MKYGFNDDVVKRIASVAYHNAKGNASSHHKHLSEVFHGISTPDTMNILSSAHTNDAMQHKFKNKDDEFSFKTFLAKAGAINRGTVETLELSDKKSVKE
jgi:hypothetical protein